MREAWRSFRDSTMQHYNIFDGGDGEVEKLRNVFPDGVADKLNFCLFSTSGVHGDYTTIDEAEKEIKRLQDREIADLPAAEIVDLPKVSFLIIHPRLVSMRFGNVVCKSMEDIEFLKKLRKSSIDAIAEIMSR